MKNQAVPFRITAAVCSGLAFLNALFMPFLYKLSLLKLAMTAFTLSATLKAAGIHYQDNSISGFQTMLTMFGVLVFLSLLMELLALILFLVQKGRGSLFFGIFTFVLSAVPAVISFFLSDSVEKLVGTAGGLLDMGLGFGGDLLTDSLGKVTGMGVYVAFLLAAIGVAAAVVAMLKSNSSPVEAFEPLSYPPVSEFLPEINTQGAVCGVTGTYKDATFQLEDGTEMVFGRDPKFCNVVFDQLNTDISRRHCGVRFNPINGLYYVTDYSRNGTFTQDGNRLQPNVPAALRQNEIFYLGNRNHSFRLG